MLAQSPVVFWSKIQGLTSRLVLISNDTCLDPGNGTKLPRDHKFLRAGCEGKRRGVRGRAGERESEGARERGSEGAREGEKEIYRSLSHVLPLPRSPTPPLLITERRRSKPHQSS